MCEGCCGNVGYSSAGGCNVDCVSATVCVRGAMEIVLSDKQLGAKRTEGYRNAFAKESVLPE